MKNYITEFLGTFFLVLTICMVICGGLDTLAPVAIGVMLMVLVYMGGHISGAHYNPAVSVAVLLRGKCTAADVIGYVISQCAGAAIAVKTTLFFLPSLKGSVPSAATLSTVPTFAAEFLGTFLLCFVILNVATSRKTEGNQFYGLAIGATVLACAYALGPVSGGAFNPAVALGITLIGMVSWANIGVFLAANLSAGVVAALLFNYIED